MDPSIILKHREKLIHSIPVVTKYIENFHSINTRWVVAITAGKIETGHLHEEAAKIFTPLLEDMGLTKEKYGKIQESLMNAILVEMTQKVIVEITDAAKFAINILKRNLFERTADVGYLATDAEIVDFLKEIKNKRALNPGNGRKETIHQRLVEYQYEYTVYDEIQLVDTSGGIVANFDEGNPAVYSRDRLLLETQAIDLHRHSSENKYVETYRKTDLRPNRGSALLYSQKIEDPANRQSLGTLCLSFGFEEELRGIFADLHQGNGSIMVAILDGGGRIIGSSDTTALPVNSRVNLDLNTAFRFLNINGHTYLASIVETDGYQGFYGLTWYGLGMIKIEDAFAGEQVDQELDKSLVSRMQNFSEELVSIKKASEELLDDMKVDSINGRVQATKFEAKAFVEILQYVKWVGEEIDDVFNSAIRNLQETIVTSLFNDVQFRAFQGNNIADRNLYERANDVCWWALTPLFRKLLTRHGNRPLGEDERAQLKDNLQYINNLYTPYLRLVLADREGRVLAVSNPPSEVEEIVVEEGLPTGQDFLDMQLPRDLVQQALRLSSSKAYCVSPFQPTALYGGRSTYIYSTGVRDPEDDRRVVGVIQIVFDAEPQFHAMLCDVLPKDDLKQILTGSFGVFVDRKKSVISSTNPDYPANSQLPLADTFFTYSKGERRSAIVDLYGQSYAVGIQVSSGYREYKNGDGYSNDVICMIFIPV